MSYEDRLKKVGEKIDYGDQKVEMWQAVILDDRDGQYYTNDLSSNRRLLTDEELTEMKSPGHGLIVLRLVDAPLPKENIKTEEQDE